MRYKIVDEPVRLYSPRLIRLLEGLYDKQYTLTVVQEEHFTRYEDTVLVVIRDTYNDNLLGALITYPAGYRFQHDTLEAQTAAYLFDSQPEGPYEFHPVRPVPVEVTVYDFEEAP